MIKMKLSCLFILFGCVYFALGDISFIPKGQRAELFEIMDNEVPTFKITLPPNEFSKLKKVTNKNYYSLEDINYAIKEIIDTINQQNFNDLFQENDFSEILPELSINEDGYLNLNETDFMINYEEYLNIDQKDYDLNEIVLKILNNNKNLNLNKVFHVLYGLQFSSMNEDLMEIINDYESCIMVDKDDNISVIKEAYIQKIKSEIMSINKLNFKETFPEINFSELLPELSIQEDGHPNIDFRNYILTTEEYKILKNTSNSLQELIFNIYNKNNNLNINKVLYFLSTSNVQINDNDSLNFIINEFKYNVMMDEDGNLIYIKENYIKIIKEIVYTFNELNFTEAFPGYNFTELLPELPIKEDGHPNIDFKIYIIPNEELEKLKMMFKNDQEFIFNILNNNKSLNLIKVFYVLSRLNHFLFNNYNNFNYYLNSFRNIMIDDNGNFCYIKEEYNINIKELIESINEQNFTEVFPGYNFTELLPELPIQEDGHPNIDFRNYFISDEEYNNLEFKYEKEETINFHIFNNNENLNLIKVIYTLSKLDNIYNNDSNNHNDYYDYYNDDYDNYDKYYYNIFIRLLKLYGENNVTMNENNEFIFNNNIENNYDYNNYYNNNYYNNNTSTIYNHDDDEFKTKNSTLTVQINNTIYNQDDDEFKTKNSTLTVQINNKELSFSKITFSLGGQNSREYAKVGFNLKIRGGKELFGRRQFKLRSDASEPSYMRTKLMCDIHNKLGLPSISANYITLYINDEFMGLYILTDAYKESWIEYVYGEKDTTNLYKCEKCNLTNKMKSGFENENKEATDKQELYEFLQAMTKAKSSVDVESIFDVDQFYKEIAIEYLSSSWDHFNNKHNYYVYKNLQNNKWIYLIHDFDLDMCSHFDEFGECIKYDFNNFESNSIIKTLISSNIEHFNEILKEIVTNVFNPATLFPRIDEIKSFIKPYVQLDKTPNDVGEYPGRMNKNNKTFYTMEQWEASTEFDESMFGLKQFILLRYRYICKKHNIECYPKYLDENMNMNLTITETSSLYPTETEIYSLYPTETEISSFIIQTSTYDSIKIETTTSIEDTILPTTTSIFDSNIDETTTSSAFNPTNIEFTTSVEDIILPTTASIEDTIIPTETITTFKCLSEFIGYPCCSSELTTVYAHDEYGDWSYDFTKNEWCGLTKFEDSSNQEDFGECWSEILGYPCCKGCKIFETDSDGSWGYELNQWCGIISSHCQKE